MPNTVIVGAQWGDEGKAKVIDYLTSKADVIARFQGGANAGHTVVVDDSKYVFHLVPSGIIYPEKVCVIGNGVVFDAEQFLREVDEIAAQGISIEGRLFISDRAHLVLPYHKEQDKMSEADKGKGRIGTTGRGIGPAYSDKVSRRGIRAGEMRDWATFEERVRTLVTRKSSLMTDYYHSANELDPDQVLEQYRDIRERILPFLIDTSRYIFEAAREGRHILFEGAQGTFLDIDHGTYPFVTSSNTIAGSVCTGLGIGPSLVDHVVGIVKTYTTRVGNGPFPTELEDEKGETLRRAGGEFGATTGRPRRCGWFDSVMVRKAVELNGMTRLALTKLDVLNGFDEVRVCTHYRIGDETVTNFPSDSRLLERAEPVYESLPGWNSDIGTARTFDDLPKEAQAYVRRIQELSHKVRILIVSVGPDRNQTIEVDSLDH